MTSADAGGRTLALAGATGFLGRRLVRAFIGDGWRVRALVRRDGDAAALAAEGAAPVRGDLADIEALAELTQGADATVNCAGLIKARDLAGFMAVNRDGAARLAAAASGRVVLVSSLAAREPRLSDYAASKRAGEAASRAAAGDRLAVIRPPVIYGPGDRETLGLFRLACASPIAPTPAAPQARLALAHADDVAAQIIHLAAASGLAGDYAVGGDRPEGYGWREIVDTAWAAAGRRPVVLPLPIWSLAAAGALADAARPLRRRPMIFGAGKVREMTHPDWSVAPSEQAPGAPAARFTLAAGFADALAWYRQAGWLAPAERGGGRG